MISFVVNKYQYFNQTDNVALYVQEIGGYFEVQRHNIEFFVPLEYKEFILIKFPFLEEVDYII